MKIGYLVEMMCEKKVVGANLQLNYVIGVYV
jgi:hypothetical protein